MVVYLDFFPRGVVVGFCLSVFERRQHGAVFRDLVADHAEHFLKTGDQFRVFQIVNGVPDGVHGVSRVALSFHDARTINVLKNTAVRIRFTHRAVLIIRSTEK